MSILVGLIVLLPFVSALVLGFSYLYDTQKRLSNRYYTIIAVGVPVIITLLSFILIFEAMGRTKDFVVLAHLFTWVDIGEFTIDFGFMVDRLSLVMIGFITFIATLIHIYAVGYMSEDEGFGKFFAYFNLFLGSMLLLVLASNPIIMFIGWELVGLASYLLIGFYHKVSTNITAANKAFIVNRVGDFGFIIGLSVLFITLEGEGFTFVDIANGIGGLSSSTLTFVGLMLFIGAMGKSAQIPLYVWLPDAMAGPTPVSALIHAATMVTAGLYLVARFGFLYNEIPHIGEFIAYVGAFSALMAALIASFQRDIKKILAYSTMSQLGYMFIAVGLGAYSTGIFHVFTHAFFKALLFMGAGAVIVALHHEQDIFKMGNLRRYLPKTYMTMLIATLAIASIPPFAGFFSKEAIINHAYFSGNYTIWLISIFTAFLTAFYMFRLIFVVFIANEQKSYSNLHKLGKVMIYPLIILAVGSASVGFLGVGHTFQGFLALPDSTYLIAHTTEYTLMAVNILVSVAGIYLAYRLFASNPQEPKADIPMKVLFINKFYVDELYHYVFVKGIQRLSNFFDRVVDDKIIDGFLGVFTKSYFYTAKVFNFFQDGTVRHYAIYILFSVSLISMALFVLLEVQ
jgi:NADH-quinone oxidoreductase subunit L